MFFRPKPTFGVEEEKQSPTRDGSGPLPVLQLSPPAIASEIGESSREETKNDEEFGREPNEAAEEEPQPLDESSFHSAEGNGVDSDGEGEGVFFYSEPGAELLKELENFEEEDQHQPSIAFGNEGEEGVEESDDGSEAESEPDLQPEASANDDDDEEEGEEEEQEEEQQQEEEQEQEQEIAMDSVSHGTPEAHAQVILEPEAEQPVETAQPQTLEGGGTAEEGAGGDIEAADHSDPVLASTASETAEAVEAEELSGSVGGVGAVEADVGDDENSEEAGVDEVADSDAEEASTPAEERMPSEDVDAEAEEADPHVSAQDATDHDGEAGSEESVAEDQEDVYEPVEETTLMASTDHAASDHPTVAAEEKSDEGLYEDEQAPELVAQSEEEPMATSDGPSNSDVGENSSEAEVPGHEGEEVTSEQPAEQGELALGEEFFAPEETTTADSRIHETEEGQFGSEAQGNEDQGAISPRGPAPPATDTGSEAVDLQEGDAGASNDYSLSTGAEDEEQSEPGPSVSQASGISQGSSSEVEGSAPGDRKDDTVDNLSTTVNLSVAASEDTDPIDVAHMEEAMEHNIEGNDSTPQATGSFPYSETRSPEPEAIADSKETISEAEGTSFIQSQSHPVKEKPGRMVEAEDAKERPNDELTESSWGYWLSAGAIILGAATATYFVLRRKGL